jgi:hypothetical protein
LGIRFVLGSSSLFQEWASGYELFFGIAIIAPKNIY